MKKTVSSFALTLLLTIAANAAHTYVCQTSASNMIGLGEYHVIQLLSPSAADVKRGVVTVNGNVLVVGATEKAAKVAVEDTLLKISGVAVRQPNTGESFQQSTGPFEVALDTKAKILSYQIEKLTIQIPCSLQ